MYLQKDHDIKRYSPKHDFGLTSEQVKERIENKLTNIPPKSQTRSTGVIIRENVLTLFNILNICIAALIISFGQYRNLLFMGVVITTVFMGIFQEIRAKRTIDKLSIISQQHITAIRNGEKINISVEEIVLDDILILNTGDQICTDGLVLVSEGLEVNEALITGESDAVKKEIDSEVSSGSFVSSGMGIIQAVSVGTDSSASKLCEEARKEKKAKSQLILSLNKIIKVLTIIIIPIGIMLYFSEMLAGRSIDRTITSVAGALIGMIPEGLVLLTNIAFAVGVITLGKHRTLVQRLPSIEAIARIDVLCLDKTGTITDGELSVRELVNVDDFDKAEIEKIIGQLMLCLKDQNTTAHALRNTYNANAALMECIYTVPFSSARKWSGATFRNNGTYIMGAPEFICSEGDKALNMSHEYAEAGSRVIALAHSSTGLESDDLPQGLESVALIILDDHIRPQAMDTFKYFSEQDVEIKVISGDNTATVSAIAKRAGLKNWDKCIDMSTYEGGDFAEAANGYTIFGRVSPHQKRDLIKALKESGHCVGMTGDGVNDVLALKEADCSVAMANGSDASRSVSDLVLLDSNFDALIPAVYEGRRVINNIERVASLYLVKTIFSTVLAIIYILLPFTYPFIPIQLTLVSTLTIGIPTFFLALKPNKKRIQGNFLQSVLLKAVPTATAVIINVLLIQWLGHMSNLSYPDTSTLATMLTGACGFILLYEVSKPFDIKRKILFVSVLAGFIAGFVFAGTIFNFSDVFSRLAFFYIPLIGLQFPLIKLLRRFFRKITARGR